MPDTYQTPDDARRLVVIDLLDRPGGRERERLYRALRHFDRAEVDQAIRSLAQAGVVTESPRRVKASEALACLEHLSLIGV